jgi:hypothetical protein
MTDAAAKQRQGRSPAYPSVSLATALEKAQAQYEKLGKYPTPLPLAFEAWGYSPKSSGGRDVRASLRYFGLATFEGEGDKAKVKLTEDTLRVLTDQREDQSEKKAIIRRLALNPTAHKKLWSQFPPPDGIKSDAAAIHFLMWDVTGFNKTSAETLVAQFKQTAAFSGLYEPDSMDVNRDADGGSDNLPEDEPDDNDGERERKRREHQPKGQVKLMEGERVAFTEEGLPGQYLKLIASGDIDETLLEALQDFVKRQRKRLGLPEAAVPPKAN